MRAILLMSAILLAGCVEPPPPSPEAMRLVEACEGGNLDACAYLENNRLAEQRSRQQAYQTMRANTRIQPMQNWPMMEANQHAPQQTTCRNSYGQVNCTTY